MSDIFYDNGTVFFVTETGDLPASPYWMDFIRIGVSTDRVDSDDYGNAAFVDENDKILALQMEDPVTDDGTPKESVLHWLRGMLGESDIVSFLEMMKECKAQMAEAGA
jgi:hypothetical protein